MSDPQITPEDSLQVAQRALSKVNDLAGRLDEGEKEREELRDDLTSALLRLSELDDDRDYEALQREDRIGIVREHAFDRATDNGGRAAIDYKDVKYGAFDGEPSPSYCYDLMRWACGHGEDAHRDMGTGVEGFKLHDPDAGNLQLIVDAERAKAARDLLSAKNPAEESGVI